MIRPITAKIAVNKILKEHLFKGKKDTYLDIVIWPNKHGEDEWGNTHYITQSFSKQARESGVKGEILGNMKMPGEQQEKPVARAPRPAGSGVPKPPADADLDCADSEIQF